MAVLVNHQILSEIEHGDIIIVPFDSKKLNTVSYDVSLGRFIAKIRPDLKSIDINRDLGADDFEVIDLGVDGVLELGPGDRCLGHTDEFIGGLNTVTTEMRARSSWGRWGLQACGCAGWGDVGYYNRYVCEIVNLNQIPIKIKVGTVFAQIIFHKVAPPNDGSQYFQTGQYQTESDVEKLRASWRPEMMLPKPVKIAPPAANESR